MIEAFGPDLTVYFPQTRRERSNPFRGAPQPPSWPVGSAPISQFRCRYEGGVDMGARRSDEELWVVCSCTTIVSLSPLHRAPIPASRTRPLAPRARLLPQVFAHSEKMRGRGGEGAGGGRGVARAGAGGGLHALWGRGSGLVGSGPPVTLEKIAARVKV